MSPGLSKPVARAAAERGTPFLLSVATVSDILHARDLGLRSLKFFPAVASGGIAALKALAAPFPDVRFCPTSGITLASAPEWLAIPEVRWVGGSWLAPRGSVDARAVKAGTRAAATLAR